MTLERVLIVVNPSSGRGRPALDVVHDVLDCANVAWEDRCIERPGDVERFCEEAEGDAFDAVAVCGGDGTVAEAAGALAGTSVPLAVLPCGTGNGAAGALGIPGDLAQAAQLLVDGEIRSVDVGRVGSRAFLVRCATGVVADIDADASSAMKQRIGGLAYGFAALRVLGAAEPSRYVIETDRGRLEAEGIACVVANGGAVGRFGFDLAPRISMTDGVLDAFVFTRHYLDGIRQMLRAAVRPLGRETDVPRIAGSEIRIAAEPTVDSVADGEKVGATPVTVTCLPSALRVVVPREER